MREVDGLRLGDTHMIQWTTEALDIVLPVDLTGASCVVTVQQRQSYATAGVTIMDDAPTVTVADGTTTVNATFTQAQMGQLSKGEATVQCNWVFGDGSRGAMLEVPVRVHHNHIEEVLT